MVERAKKIKQNHFSAHRLWESIIPIFPSFLRWDKALKRPSDLAQGHN